MCFTAMYPQRGIVVWNLPASTSVMQGVPSADSFTSTEYAPSGLGSIAPTDFCPESLTRWSWIVLETDGVPVMPEGEMCLKGYSSRSREYDVTSLPSFQRLSQAMFFPGRYSWMMKSSTVPTPLLTQSSTQSLASAASLHSRLSLPPAPRLARTQSGLPSLENAPRMSAKLVMRTVFATATPPALSFSCERSLSCAILMTRAWGRKTLEGIPSLLPETT